jgi:hypothetical protein
MPIHVVAEGDCLSSIAEKYGWFWQTLWNHADNQALRDSRQNPNVLLAGDKVVIPDKREKDESCVTTMVHKFRLKGVPCRFVLRLLDEEDLPREGVSYTLEVEGKKKRGVTGEDGLISEIISPHAKTATLTVHDPDDPEADEKHEFDLGNLPPVSDPEGVEARLRNLGFESWASDEDDWVTAALQEFQKRHGLAATGKADDATRDALLRIHGS